MLAFFRTLTAAFVLGAPLVTANAQTPPAKPAPPSASGDDYEPGPDSKRQPGVPTGKSFQFKLTESKIFPGTAREVTVYVPAQYKADKPACVFISLDGMAFAAPIVFDNLIQRNEMPVTIAVAFSPGQVESANPPKNPRFNRSFEFDGLNKTLARFVTDELLPAVEKRQTPDGLPILLSKDPNDRCVAGGSTGAIGAFTMAWERPDAFRRVFSAIGTYVGMRGGDRYPVLVRKTEPKPIRIFMQDGSNDEWMGGPEVGDWWMGNQTLERALEFAGYEVEHVWGTGRHSGKQATAIFPDAMRWLWKDWPKPVTAGESQNTFLKAVLAPGENWSVVAEGSPFLNDLQVDAEGNVIFCDTDVEKCYKLVEGGKSSPFQTPAGLGPVLAFGPDGRMYFADAVSGKIFSEAPGEKPVEIAHGIRACYMTVTHVGNIYLADGGSGNMGGKLWFLGAHGENKLLDVGLNHAAGLAVSPDGLWLAVAESGTHWGYSYRLEADGTVADKQRFYWFHVPDTEENSGAGNLCSDRDGRLYAATAMGVQVLDRNGRVRAIIPAPRGAVTSVCIGGANFDTLYVTSGANVFQRKLKARGWPGWAKFITLPPWGAG